MPVTRVEKPSDKTAIPMALRTETDEVMDHVLFAFKQKGKNLVEPVYSPIREKLCNPPRK